MPTGVLAMLIPDTIAVLKKGLNLTLLSTWKHICACGFNFHDLKGTAYVQFLTTSIFSRVVCQIFSLYSLHYVECKIAINIDNIPKPHII